MRLLLEEKGETLALHYRAVPTLAGPLREAITKLVATSPDHRLIEGKMVLEVAPAAIDKGSAIRRFMMEAPFVQRRPVFAGDDVTDEDGFKAVLALGGFAIKVGPGSSSANFRAASTGALLDWLCTLPGALPPRGPASTGAPTP